MILLETPGAAPRRRSLAAILGSMLGLVAAAAPSPALAGAKTPEPVLAFPREARPRPTAADMLPEVAREDEYAESLAFTAWLRSGARVNVVLAVSNIGIGSGNGGTKAVVVLPGGERIAFSEDVGKKWSAQPAPLRYAIGSVVAEGTLGRLVVTLQHKKIQGRLVFRAQLPPWRPRGGRVYYNGPPGDKKTRFYDYLAVMPRAEVSGELRVNGRTLAAAGTGFLERSRVNLYPFEQAVRWRSLKVFHGDHTLVVNWFRTSPKYGSREIAWAIVGEKGRIVWQHHAPRLQVSDLRLDRGASAQYQVPWSIALTAQAKRPPGRQVAGAAATVPAPPAGALGQGEPAPAAAVPGVVGTFTATGIVTREDTLKDMSRLRRMVVSRFTKPVGYAQRCRYDLVVTLDGGRRVIPLKGDDGECWQSFLK